MTFHTIRTEHKDSAFVIEFNRPEQRNAFSIEMIEETMAAVASVENDSDVRGIILTGGDRGFSAGADLTETIKVRTPQDGREFFGRWHRFCDVLETSSKPVIAAIEGYCMTGGFELALACDLRVGAQGAKFGITSSRIGTVAGAGGTQRLPRLIGSARALELMFAADPIDAEEAYRVGILNRLVEKGGALAEAHRLVGIYAERAPLSLALCKRAVHRGIQMDLASALEFELFLVTTIYGTKDKQEGIAAFLEKRSPTFRGE